MSRIEKVFEVKEEDWARFEHLNNALNHDEIEETLSVLIDIAYAAVSITDAKNRTVRMVSAQQEQKSEPCPSCGMRRSFYNKEISVQIGREEQPDAGFIKEEE
jgi:hypothetical protein